MKTSQILPLFTLFSLTILTFSQKEAETQDPTQVSSTPVTQTTGLRSAP